MGNKRYRVFLVDDDMSQLGIGKNMLKDEFEVFAIPSGEKLFEVLAHVEADIILLDIVMPGMDGYEVMAKLRANPAWAEIPVIFVTARSDEVSELRGLSLGAIDYVSKPFSSPLLIKRLQNHLRLSAHEKELRNYNDRLQYVVQEKTRQVVKLQNSILSAMAEMMEIRDSVTGSHIIRTQKYLEILVEQLKQDNIYQEEMAGWNLEFLFSSAPLHDLGKIAVSDAILNKPGKLSAGEYDEMKRHAEAGVNALQRLEETTEEHDFLEHARIIAGAHHEKWDGSGYPNGLAGRNIPLQGRLMAIADVYDALISRRPYKDALGSEDAERIICEGSGSHFDPVLVEAFKKAAGRFAEIARDYQ
jgi:putative two-component system response regulator